MFKNKKEDLEKEEFGYEKQVLFIDYILSHHEQFPLCRSILKDEYFDDQLRPAVRCILKFSDSYSGLPTVDYVYAETKIKFSGNHEGGNHNDRWFLNEIEKFCRYKALELAILDGVQLLEQGKGGEVEKRVKEAMTISLMTDLGMDYFLDPVERLQRLKDKSSYVSTGWNSLDEKLYGGFTRGALNVFVGQSGGGKSLALQNLAINWALAGLDVVYISLELSQDLISLRLDSMLTGRSTKEVMTSVNETAFLVKSKGKNAGSLTVKKLPEGGTTANDLRAYIKEYEIKTGRMPDAILVDYLDLMYPNSRHINPSDQFIKDKYTSEEMRAMADEFQILCATASQFNRSAVEAQEFDHSHIAGGISKINTADNVFGILSTASMKERGIFQLQMLKTRSSSSVGQKIDLSYDPVCMKIADPVIDLNGNEQHFSREDMRNNLKTIVPKETKPTEDNSNRLLESIARMTKRNSIANR